MTSNPSDAITVNQIESKFCHIELNLLSAESPSSSDRTAGPGHPPTVILALYTVALARKHSTEDWSTACKEMQAQSPYSAHRCGRHYTCWIWRCPRLCLPAADGAARSAKRCGFGCAAPCDVSAADADDDGCCLVRRLPCGGPPATIGRRGIWPDEYGGGWTCSCIHVHHLCCFLKTQATVQLAVHVIYSQRTLCECF